MVTEESYKEQQNSQAEPGGGMQSAKHSCCLFISHLNVRGQRAKRQVGAAQGPCHGRRQRALCARET